MKKSEPFEKTNFRSLIEADGADRIQDKLNLIDVFLGTEEHVTLEEMVHLLQGKGYDFESGFVKHCMHRMVELGFAQQKQFEGQPIRYEHHHLGRHHDHLVCTKCGKIVEFANEDMERLQVEIAAGYGFHMLQHRMEIYGLCSDCYSQRKPLMPLAMAKAGETVLVRDVAGCKHKQSRLASMGLRSGDRVEIINNMGGGRVILGLENTRLAIGRGMANRIMVSPIKDNSEA
ncbi:MAG TPA: transcriptional repressor [Desulfobacteria bacterium]|nr:transcriptional repressor [Desulfobacteria bacterium]